MTLYKRMRRWIDWKLLSPKDRAFIVHLQIAFGWNNSWEITQFNKETKRP